MSSLSLMPGHFSSIVSFVSKSRVEQRYLDLRIICSDGSLRAHRLVLASVSSFMARVLSDAEDESETLLMMPNTSVLTLNKLMEFVYSGEMHVDLENCDSLTRLVEQLQIDPQNVLVVNTKNRNYMVKDRKDSMSNGNDDSLGKEQKADRRKSRSNSTNGVSEPSAALSRPKRRASQELLNNSTSKVAKVDSSTKDAGLQSQKLMTPVMIKVSRCPSNAAPAAPSSTTVASSSVVGQRGQPRRRGRPLNVGNRGSGQVPINAATSNKTNESNNTSEVGFHDWSDVHTWVCAICKCYDPPSSSATTLSTPTTTDMSNNSTTEWVGCDCNRWFHVHCTKMESVEQDFSCDKINFKCLEQE